MSTLVGVEAMFCTSRALPHRHDDAAEKIREYRADYNNRPSNPISFMPAVASTSGHIHCELVRILFLQAHRETAFRSLQLQEFRLFSMRSTTRTSSVSAALFSTPSSNLRLTTSLESPTYQP